MSRGNNVFTRVTPKVLTKDFSGPPPKTNDFFLYALYARIALSNNDVVEFETHYDQKTNTIELTLPEEAKPLFNQITGMQRGPNFKKFIDWLIGSQTLTLGASADESFISASELQVWFGADTINVGGDRLLLSLPSCDASVLGYNLKTQPTFSGKLVVSLVWMFLSGSNTSFDIRTAATVSDSLGGGPITYTNDQNISTLGLISGDIRETTLLDTGNVIGGDKIISTLVHRNYTGSPDPQTESIGVVGIRIRLI